MQSRLSYPQSSTGSIDAKSCDIQLAQDASRSLMIQFEAKLKHNKIAIRDALLFLYNVVRFSAVKPTDPIKRMKYFVWLDQELNRLVEKEIATSQEVRLKIANLHKEISTIKKELRYLQIDEHQTDRQISVKLQQQENIVQNEVASLLQEYLPLWDRVQISSSGDIRILHDPVITNHPDKIVFEAFSTDESIYTMLAVDKSNFEVLSEESYGTTNIDFSESMREFIGKIRSNLDFFFTLLSDHVEFSDHQSTHVEKKIDLPDNWVKGFIEVSSSYALAEDNFSMNTMDLYNIITFLKRHRERFGPRYMLFHLLPNSPIEVEFLPWKKRLTLSSKYSGKTHKTLKVWGRRRLILLESLLPHVDSLQFNFINDGLPFYISTTLKGVDLVIGFSGWSQNSWSVSNLYTLKYGHTGNMEPNFEILKYLQENLVVPFSQLQSIFSDQMELFSTLLYLYRNGLGVFDPSIQSVRYRELFNFPIPRRLLLPSQDEQMASSYIHSLGPVELNQDADTLIVQSKLKSKEISLTFNEKNTVVSGICFCNKIVRNGIKKGLCAHLIALNQQYILRRV